MEEGKCILYFDGGVMAGIFSAGVGAGLLERKFSKNIEAIYGASAGALNAAYAILAEQVPLGPSIYYEDLIENFILPKNIPFGVFQRFCLRYFKTYPGKLRQALNIDLLMDVMTYKKALDLEKVKNSPVPLYVKVWDVRNKRWLFFDLRVYDNPLRLLKASVSAVPYYFSSEIIDGFECIDHCRVELGPDLVTARHPNRKIVFVVNRNRFEETPFIMGCRLLEGIVANWCFPQISKTCFVEGVRKYAEDIKKIKESKNMLLITPPIDLPIKSHITNPHELLSIYEAGKRESKKIDLLLGN